MDTLEVKGMSCQHCVASVTEALQNVPGVRDVKVSLDEGLARFEIDTPMSESEEEHLRQAVKNIGFEPGEYRRG
jgi:copper chaperone